jgi:hypothetical protein
LISILTIVGVAHSAWGLTAPTNVVASDIGNDDGGRGLAVTWDYVARTGEPELKGFVVLRRASDESSFKPVSGKEPLPPKTRRFDDKSAAPKNVGDTALREPAKSFVYLVQAHYPPSPPETAQETPATELSATTPPVTPPASPMPPAEPPPPPPDQTANSAESNPATAVGNWFHTGRVPILIATVFFGALLWALLERAKGGSVPKIRRIPGLEAVDEAIGRATEMGRPILFVPGIGGVGSIATMSAMNIYSHVAKKAGELGTSVHVPCRDPIVMQLMRTIGEQAYLDIGRPDAYHGEDVYFVTESQFAYAAAVDGIMVREQPSAIFLQGVFYAESLILAETGNSVGAIQISGTDRDSQVPFFLAACDYTLIGEELFAASAYLSKDIPLLSTIRTQDIGKAVLMAALLVGVVLQMFHIDAVAWFFNADLAR